MHSLSHAPRLRPHARLLRDLLRVEVLLDRFSHGVLPSEADLMRRFGAPRATVREALDLLRREGVVERLQGTGTLAVASRVVARMVEMHGIGDIDTAMFVSKVIDRGEIPMPPPVAHHLDEPVGAPCYMIEYVGLAGGEPTGLYTNYLRYPEAERIAATPLTTHWYAMLTEAGMDMGENDLVIEAMVAGEELAARLGIPAGRPILGMRQVIRDATGRPFNFAILRHRGDRMSLQSRVACPVVVGGRDVHR